MSKGNRDSDVTRQLEGTPPTNNWVLYTRAGTATGSFVVGPADPPRGIGSLELQTPFPSDKVYLFNYDHVGTLLVDIGAIGYSTYRDPTSVTTHPSQVPSINIQVDYNGPNEIGGFTTLVFEPVYNEIAQGAVVPGVWQDWDAFLGGQAIWWSTRPINGCLTPPAIICFQTWDTIVANNPDAYILGGFGVNQGSGND